MRGRIFISYRRDDAPGDARSIRDRLARKFGDSSVFMDVDNLFAGQRFDQELDKALTQCEVLVAIMGRRWMDLLAEHRRIGGRDYVREEIGGALKREIAVIPVLVGREGQLPILPRPEDLPRDLRDLVQYQKHGVAHETFGRDSDQLIAAVGSLLRERRSEAPWRGLALGGAAGLVAATLLAGIITATVLWSRSHSVTEAGVKRKAVTDIDASAAKMREEEERARTGGESPLAVLESGARDRFLMYERQATQGDAYAMYRVATYYEQGVGVARNRQLANFWYQKAADAGNEDAKVRLKKP